MKNSIKLMQYYLQLVETMGDIIETLEAPITQAKEQSKLFYEKHDKYVAHAQKFIGMISEDLHTLLRIDREAKEIEDLESGEEHEETKTN
jgi:hypothetical protein